MKNYMCTRHFLIYFVILFLFACSSQIKPINTTADGTAIKGYDTVAYFTTGLPTPGKQEFHYTWMNTRWLFANEEHLNLFKENPKKYAPQYGGY